MEPEAGQAGVVAHLILVLLVERRRGDDVEARLVAVQVLGQSADTRDPEVEAWAFQSTREPLVDPLELVGRERSQREGVAPMDIELPGRSLVQEHLVGPAGPGHPSLRSLGRSSCTP